MEIGREIRVPTRPQGCGESTALRRAGNGDGFSRGGGGGSGNCSGGDVSGKDEGRGRGRDGHGSGAARYGGTVVDVASVTKAYQESVQSTTNTRLACTLLLGRPWSR